ncbi:MAG TPA: hypothetical protein DCY47_00375, partial [Candidatus Accumulibacter sp.]|nr:hypothetical protein [Accumulibacter sp.]
MPTCRPCRCLASGTRLRQLCLLAITALSALVAAATSSSTWIDSNPAGERRVHLYFFWTSSCPHC